MKNAMYLRLIHYGFVMDSLWIRYGFFVDLRCISCGFLTYLSFQAGFPEKMDVIPHAGYDHNRVQDV